MTRPDSSSNLTLDKQICFSLYSASNAMARSYQPLLKKLDLTYLQYIVMMVLWQDSTMNVKELGAKVHLDSGTLTPLLKRLEAKGLVIRSRSQSDELIEQVPDMMMCKSKMTSEELSSLKQACDLLLKNLTTAD